MRRAERTKGAQPDRRPGTRRRTVPATLVLLVRHGTTATTGKELPGRAPGLHLGEAGLAEADAVAARLAARWPGDAAEPPAGRTRARSNGRSGASPRRAIAAVYSSPLERTRETAEPIGAALGREVIADDGLLELDIGDWTGLELKAARKRPEWAAIQRYPSGFTFPGGESFLDMQARIVSTLARLRRAHPGETIVAVSHADPIRAAVAHALGTHLDLFQRLVISPCSFTAIAYGDAGPTVLTVNATGDAVAVVPS
jgi:probable phosphoglycerate mutase